MTESFYGITSNNIKKFIELGFEKGFMDPNEFIEYLIQDERNKKYISVTQIQWTQLIKEKKYKELDHENTLFKIANAELRDQLDTINTRLENAFYDDHTSFWDVMTSIKKTLKKDSTNGKE